MTALRTAVNNSSAKILITEVSTGVNIDIRTSSENAWKTYGVPSGVAAFTLMYDTDGKRIEGYYDASGSTGKLDYANILLNPKESASGYADIAYPSSDTVQTNVLIHEVGHAIGLWHCTHSYPSVMKPITSSSPAYFTAHDNDCLKAYYGS